MKQKFTFYVFCMLLYSLLGASMHLQAQVINQFPYVNNFESENLTGWELTLTNRKYDYSYGGYYYLNLNNNDVITTPELDLSRLKKPCIRIYTTATNFKNLMDFYISEDGIHYTAAGQEASSILLSPKTKYIRIKGTGSIRLRRIEIAEYTEEPMIYNLGGLEWVKTATGYVLKSNDKQTTGTAALYFPVLPGVQSQVLQLTVNNLNTNLVTIKGITANGAQMLSNNSFCTIEATLKENAGSANPSLAALSDMLYIPYTIGVPSADLFYDYDGDGIKEFYKQGGYKEGNNIYYPLLSYKWVEKSAYRADTLFNMHHHGTISVLNINNDPYPDFGNEGIGYIDDPKVIYRSESDKSYTMLENMQARQWDVNNDGRTDLYSEEGFDRRADFRYIHIQNADGSFTKSLLEIVSADDLTDSTVYKTWSQAGNGSTWNATSGIPSLKNGWMIGSGKTLPASFTTNTEVDLNKDGLPDLLDTSTGNILYNIGNNKFVQGHQEGKLTVKDLNGDFITDYIFYDPKAKTVTTWVYQGSGEFKSQELIKNLSISNIYCYDFDKDGDIDILLTFDYTTASGYAYLVLCENDGKGNFKIHENYYEEPYLFKVCADIDNDGYYDVLATNSQALDVFLFKGTSNLKFLAPTLVTTSPAEIYSLMLQDFLNEGNYQLCISLRGASYLHSFDNVTPNKAPEKPEAPHYSLNTETGMLHVTWKTGKDKESSSADLTYALRVGSQPGLCDIYYAHANADGSRRNFAPGNMGANLDKYLNIKGWLPGNYYIAIQTIDPMYKGSSWSDEVMYTHTLLSSEFSVSKYELTTSDTLTVALPGRALHGYNYNWQLADARILEQNADGSVLKLMFDTHGTKTLSLQVDDTQGNYSQSYESDIEVFPSRFTPIKNELYFLLDIDGDGIADGIGKNGIYANEGDGIFKKVPKIYNSDLSIYQSDDWQSLDFNMDGLPDVAIMTNKGNLLLNKYEQNFELTNETFIKDGSKKNTLEEGILIDLNNDGFLDQIIQQDRSISCKLYKNEGDNKNFTSFNLVKDSYSSFIKYFIPVDYNKDGLVDLFNTRSFFTSGVGNRDYSYLYINKGNFIFEEKELDLGDFLIDYVEDMNNDGCIDLICQKNSKTIQILVGTKELDFSEKVDIHLPHNYSLKRIMSVQDFDNNGYPDLLLSVEDDTEMGATAILYFYPGLETKLSTPVSNSLGTIDYLTAQILAMPFYLDVNGDNVPDAINGIQSSKVTNTAPHAPANVRAKQTESGLLIEWDAAYDAETPYSQMRYNVSVRKKGATGDHSYILSPMNGLKDEACIVPGHYYSRSTRMEIPMERIPAGAYEIQIQSIDLWNAHSPLSAPFVIETAAQLTIETPESACVDVPAKILYRGSESTTGSFAWDWDGGTVVSGTGSGPYQIKWSTPGVKNIKVTTNGVSASTALIVGQGTFYDLNFTLPSIVLAGVEVSFELPELLMNPEIAYHFNQSNSNIVVSRRTGTREAKVIFPENGGSKQWIELEIESSGCTSPVFRQSVDVKEGLATPQISIVTIDGETGKNKIIWDKKNVHLTSSVTEMAIYREGSRYNQFSEVGAINPLTGEFIDLTSNPQVTTSRYSIAYHTVYDIASNKSTPHRSTHLMLNQGMGSAINLVWTQYEGGIIDSYRIYRGATPETMTLLTEIPGSTNTYTDMTPPSGVFYYALEYDQTYNPEWVIEKSQVKNRAMKAAATKVSARSNVVSVVNASVLTFVESVSILALEETLALNDAQTTLHLYTEFKPVTADYKNVTWMILEGENLAYINPRGLLTSTGNGKGVVRLRAIAIDGSNAYGDIEIPVERTTVDLPVVEEKEKSEIAIYPNPVKDLFWLKGVEDEQITLRLYDVNGQQVFNLHTKGDQYIDISFLPKGLYLLKVQTKHSSFDQKVIKL